MQSQASSLIDRQRGCLIGLAVGDALGAAVEFEQPEMFEPVTGYRDGGPHGLAAGEWTDDTSMALALADSIASVGWDLDELARRYVSWWRSGKFSINGRCFDIGNATHTALVRGECPDAMESGPGIVALRFAAADWMALRERRPAVGTELAWAGERLPAVRAELSGPATHCQNQHQDQHGEGQTNQ